MTTVDQQYQKSTMGQTYELSKEWNAHKERILDHIATIVEQQKVVYDVLSETWDAQGMDLRAQVSCSIEGGRYSCKMLGRLINAFSIKVYEQQIKASNERLNGHLKVLRRFYNAVERADEGIKDLERALESEGALSPEQHEEWAFASKELSGHFAQVLEVCNIEKYALLDLWEDFHIKGRQLIAALPDGEDKKDLALAWETMAIKMNTQVMNMMIAVRVRLDDIERDCFQSEYELHKQLSSAFKDDADN